MKVKVRKHKQSPAQVQDVKLEVKIQKEFDIKNAKGNETYESFGGEIVYLPAFKTNEEKERASKIAEQLKGMTIREAKAFLTRVSDAIEDVLFQ